LIEMPLDVPLIDDSAFIDSKLHSISIEAGHDRFMIKNDILIDIIDHRSIRNFARSANPLPSTELNREHFHIHDFN
jgi:hypothetical protein